MDDALPEHDDAAGVAFLTSGGEIKQKTAPYPQFAVRVTLEPEAPEVNRVVQKQHVAGFAVLAGGLQDKILDGFGPPPIPDSEASDKQPEECSKSQWTGNPVGGNCPGAKRDRPIKPQDYPILYRFGKLTGWS